MLALIVFLIRLYIFQSKIAPKVDDLFFSLSIVPAQRALLRPTGAQRTQGLNQKTDRQNIFQKRGRSVPGTFRTSRQPVSGAVVRKDVRDRDLAMLQ